MCDIIADGTCIIESPYKDNFNAVTCHDIGEIRKMWKTAYEKNLCITIFFQAIISYSHENNNYNKGVYVIQEQRFVLVAPQVILYCNIKSSELIH